MRDTVFLFTTCQPGAEAALKKELAREHPELRFAYSRPGFVTFKRHDGVALTPDFELRSVFARAYGLSLGKSMGDPTPIIETARELASSGARPVIHVWERDRHVAGDEPLGFVPDEWASPARTQILEAARACGLEFSTQDPQPGTPVLDVVAVEPGEWWYGYHTHEPPRHAPWPGGKPVIQQPAAAPSRAYTKLEEAIRWSRAPLRAGDIAIEIGSAPGGACYSLLERGLDVVGIDPGEMDAAVLRHPRFVHIQRPVARVAREELPERIDWLLLDMNVEPSISVFAVDRLAGRTRDTLLGVFLTIKLNQWKIADEIPGILDHVRAMGMAQARAVQLPSNRQEILIHGLTKLGLRRLGMVHAPSR